MDKIYHNCYFGLQSKDEKREVRVLKNRRRHKQHRDNKHQRVLQNVQNLTKEERMDYFIKSRQNRGELETRLAKA